MRVLAHPPPDSGAFVAAWSTALADITDLRRLTPGAALRHPRDVAHVHWPEHLLHDRHRPTLKLVHGALLAMILIARPGPLVVTMHNRRPHHGFSNRVERAFYERLIARADRVVRLLEGESAADGPWAGRDSIVIPLAPIDAPSAMPRRDRASRPLRLLHLGSIAPYKAQMAVVDALEPRIAAGDIELVVVGRVIDDGEGARLAAAAERLDHLRVVSEHVSEADLLSHLAAADLVIGVQVGSYNSGVPATALPAGRPVVLTSGVQAADHRARYGVDWVLEVDDPTDRAEWFTLLDEFEVPTGPVPRLPTWDETAAAHLALYRELRS